MSKEKSPSYSRYPKDYLADIKVQAMTLEEEGMYNRLMDYCWLEASLPKDPKILAALCKGKAPTELVLSCFRDATNVGTDVRILHPRLDLEREDQAKWRAKCAAAGRKSAHKRKHPKENDIEQVSSTVVQPDRLNVSATSLISVPCSLISDQKNPQSPQGGNGSEPQRQLFETFYRAYPRHENPVGAQRAFRKSGVTANDLPQILDWIEKAKQSSQWQERDKIPMATTFLNQRRWKGDPPPLPVAEQESIFDRIEREEANAK